MTEQKREYSYDDLFPERWLHAPDLDGKTVTLVITDLYAETVVNPKTKKKDECGIVSFARTPREYVLSKQNAWILKTVFGPKKADVYGKSITISPVPDTSGFTEHGVRILFTGSPDIERDTPLTLPGGTKVAFKKTAAKRGEVVEGNVDAITGEVTQQGETLPVADRFTGTDEDIGFTEEAPFATGAAEDYAGGDETPNATTDAESGQIDEDGHIPGIDAAGLKARNARRTP